MRSTLAVALSLVLLACCSVPALAAEKDEPARVVVQHILIAFKKSVPGKPITRSKDEARALAEELLRRAKEGEDFDALVKQYTDDRYPGRMSITNSGAPTRGDSSKRADVVPAFGDVAFALAVGEIGLAGFSYRTSPYGWHIVKRLE